MQHHILEEACQTRKLEKQQFTPNIPTDIESSTNAISTLSTAGAISTETKADMAAQITGVSANDEMSRLESEPDDDEQTKTPQ